MLTSGVSFPNFNDSSGLILLGDAQITLDDRLRVIDASYGDQGAAWASDKQFASVGFESTFEFQVSGGAGDAFAFVLQNAGDNALGRLAGYKEIPNSLAVEFDVGYDPQNGDPDDNHVSVHTRGVERNDVDHAYAIGCVTAPFDIDDGSTHTVKITYTPGILDIYLTDLTIPALTVPIDLAETLDLDVGRSYVGFTASGGQNFDILSWHFQNTADVSSVVGVEKLSQLEGNSGSTPFSFRAVRMGDTTQALSVIWTTSPGTASAGDDYTAATGEINFAAGDAEEFIEVSIIGDTEEESHETFFLNLSIGSGLATLVTDWTVGIILNDEATISITDDEIMEGDKETQFIDVFTPADIFTAANIEPGPDGRLYITTGSPGTVVRFDPQTEAFSLFATHNLMVKPMICFGPDGNLYVADKSMDLVLKFDGATGDFIEVFVAQGAGGMSMPQGLAFGPDGHLYVASTDTDNVLCFDGQTGTLLGEFVSSGQGGLDGPTAILFAPDGNLYVGSSVTNSILRYDANSGDFVDAFIPAGYGGLASPRVGGVKFGPDRNGDGVDDLYVSSGGTNEVLAYDGLNGVFLESYVSPGQGGLDTPWGISFDEQDNLLVTMIVKPENRRILRFGGAYQGIFTVSLSAPVGMPVSVDFTTVDGTAIAGSDYLSAAGVLTFDPGVTSRTIIVPTLDDGVVENNEEFSVQLSNPVGASLIGSLAQGLILDPTIHTSLDVPKSLADGKNHARPGVTRSIIDVVGPGRVFDLNVHLDISHTYVGQLSAKLSAPNGTAVELFSNVGGSGDNFTNTELDEQAETPITYSSAPFTGTFQPEGSLAAFNDLDAAGSWTLEIVDDTKGDTGTLNSWSLGISTYAPEPNASPVAVDDSASTNEDAAVIIDVLANDSDPDPGDMLAVSSVTQGANGYVSDNGDGTVTYTPNPDFNGSDSFTYTISDGNGGTDTATVSVSVISVDDPPVADAGGPYTVEVEGTVQLDASGSTDPDLPYGDILTYAWDFDGDNIFDDASGLAPIFDATGLAEGTIVDVSVQVTDSTSNNSTSATTVTVQSAAAGMHVADLDGVSSDVNKRKWRATVTVLVVDGSGSPVSDASVSGSWSNAVSSMATTDPDGLATVSSGNMDKSLGSVTFQVSSITHATLQYDPAANMDPDGDSDGTSIVVYQGGAATSSLLAARDNQTVASEPSLTSSTSSSSTQDSTAEDTLIVGQRTAADDDSLVKEAGSTASVDEAFAELEPDLLDDELLDDLVQPLL